jgi:hypothetical protein
MNVQNAQSAIRNNIISLFGIETLPEEKQEEVIGKIGKMIFQAVLMRVLPMLEEEDLKDYDALVSQKPGPDEVMGFFLDKVPNFLDIVAEESENFRKDAEDVLKQVN